MLPWKEMRPSLSQSVWFRGALISTALLFALNPASPSPRAETDTQKRIEEKNQEIKRLEEEAGKYRVTLDDLERTADTLEARLRTVDRAINRLAANIRLTDAKITRTGLEIQQFDAEIRSTASDIGTQRERLARFVATLASSEQETPLEALIRHETIAAFFSTVDNIRILQQSIQSVLAELRSAKHELEADKARAEGKRFELAALAEDLADQKTLQESERRERSNLLGETKRQERRYQELLAEVERKREALQEEINALESELASSFDRANLPKPGSGVLGWPLPDPISITQYFGRTAFARSGAYSGKGHNGIDFRAALGTPVFASTDGKVRATGDTDTACRRASYGRWILLDHPNNLSTLYAHLSLTKVRAGDTVNRGELIGYSGKTGYATGPHLHLSVFATQAVEVSQFRSRVCGRMMTVPLSPFGGYLNPLDYLKES